MLIVVRYAGIGPHVEATVGVCPSTYLNGADSETRTICQALKQETVLPS
jgi:hypothetical protein